MAHVLNLAVQQLFKNFKKNDEQSNVFHSSYSDDDSDSDWSDIDDEAPQAPETEADSSSSDDDAPLPASRTARTRAAVPTPHSKVVSNLTGRHVNVITPVSVKASAINHLSATDAAPKPDQTVDVVERLSFIVRKIRQSLKLRRLLKKLCIKKKVEELIPIINVQTRWNSTYDMLERALKMKEVISDTVYGSKNDALIAKKLDQTDWKCIRNLLDVLTPFKHATEIVSKSSDSFCITHALPVYGFCAHSLEKSIGKYQKTDTMYKSIEDSLSKLNQYYDSISPIAGVALILNPTLKKDFLKTGLKWKDTWVKTATD